MNDGLVKILDGNTFVVSDERGDIEASLTDPTGLFSFDTRFLSKWILTVNGERLNALSTDDLQYFETRFFLVPGTGTVYIDAKLSVIRQRAVANGFDEKLTILNHDEKPVDSHSSHRGWERLRRPVRGQGRARKEGQLLESGAGRPSGALLPARDVQESDNDLGDGAGEDRQDRSDLQSPPRAPRGLVDPAEREGGPAGGGAGKPAQHAARSGEMARWCTSARM